MVTWKRKEPPPIVAEVAKKLEEFNKPARPLRPLLEQIHADRLNKQVELNRLDREVSRLVAFEQWLETHEQADSLVEYFVQRAVGPAQAGLVPPKAM